MALVLVTKEKLTAIANALRQKLGVSTGYRLDDIPAAILSIVEVSGDNGYKYEKVSVTGNNSNILSFPTKGTAIHFCVAIKPENGFPSGSSIRVALSYDSDSNYATGANITRTSASLIDMACSKSVSSSKVQLTLEAGNAFSNSATYDFFYIYE